MNDKSLDYEQIYAFAKDIIVHTPNFRDFAVAVMDFAGGVTADVFTIYKELRGIRFPAGVMLDDPEEIARYTIADLTRWYEKFQKIRKVEYEEEKKKVKENIDELQYLIEEYRNSDRFLKMLNFVSNFPYLAPYNAMLVQIQKPGASFVFTAGKWMYGYSRQPKPNAQPLLTLIPFGPLQVMFDYEDTEPIPGTKCADKEDLMKEWNSTLTKARGKVDPQMWRNLTENLPNYGIRFDANFNASNSYGGYLLKTEKHEVQLEVMRGDFIEIPARFVLSVNKNESQVSQFHTICHELGHLFCRHLFYDKKKERRPSHKEREFEAETVAWLVCKRHGISNPSEEYLAWYSRDGEIPTCSLEYVMKAVAEIEKILKDIVPVKKALWYANDKQMKDAVDKEINNKQDVLPIISLF